MVNKLKEEITSVLLVILMVVAVAGVWNYYSRQVKTLEKALDMSEYRVEALTARNARIDAATEQMRAREVYRESEYEAIKIENARLKAENEDYRAVLELSIPGPCLIGLRGYVEDECGLPAGSGVPDAKNK